MENIDRMSGVQQFSYNREARPIHTSRNLDTVSPCKNNNNIVTSEEIALLVSLTGTEIQDDNSQILRDNSLERYKMMQAVRQKNKISADEMKKLHQLVDEPQELQNVHVGQKRKKLL